MIRTVQLIGGTKMLGPIAASIIALVTYLTLTAGSGKVIVWSPVEMAVGVVLSALTGYVYLRSMPMSEDRKPSAGAGRYFRALIYPIYPFFFAMMKANLDVAYRVITMNIRPGIVRISPGYKRDASVTALANSITLTPGTLSVDVDDETNDLFVHWINVKEGDEKYPVCKSEHVCGSFAEWIRRIFE